MATRDDITKALLELQFMPNSPINDTNVTQIVAQYETDLGDLPADILKAATLYYRTGGNQFFPTSGQLRERATDLLLMAMDVPTAAQAWAQVITAVRFKDSVWCDEGERLYHGVDGKTGRAYWDAIHAYKTHAENCEECDRGGFGEVYEHPIVEKVVRLMGGRDRILEGDVSVCRSLFLKGYNEIVLRETKIATMPKPVKESMMLTNEPFREISLLAEGKRIK